MPFNINAWRKKAISLYGKSRGLTKTERDAVTAAVHGRSSTPKKRKTIKRGGNVPKKKKRRAKGSRIMGNLGWKGLLIGTGALAGIKYLTRKFFGAAGAYADGASMVVASMLPVSGVKGLRSAGVIELGSEFIADLLQPNGLVTVPTQLGTTKQGGYDY